MAKNITVFRDISLYCSNYKEENDRDFCSLFTEQVPCNLALCICIADSNCAWVLKNN